MDDDGCAVIRIHAGFLHQIGDEGQGVLMQATLACCQRGNIMVSTENNLRRSRTGTRSINRSRSTFGRTASTPAGQWKRSDKHFGEWPSTDCPRKIVEIFLILDGQRRLKVVDAGWKTLKCMRLSKKGLRRTRS